MKACPLAGTDAARSNHHWPLAREVALRRDGYRCTVCHSDGSPPALAFGRLLLAILRPPCPASFQAWRERQWPDLWQSADAGLRTQLRLAYDAHRRRLALPFETVAGEVAAIEARAGIEVHHVRPCRGRHGQDGCWHHVAGLRTLCHECHKKAGRGALLLAS